MYKVCFVVEGLSDPELARSVAGVLLGAQTLIDEIYLRAHPETPTLARSGVRLHDLPQGPKRPGRAYKQDVPVSLREGYADQASLSCWRAAELRVREGVKALPLVRAFRMPDERTAVRAEVVLPDGTVIDPSHGRGAATVLYDRQRWTFVLGLFERDRDRELSDATLQVLLDALAEIDVLHYRTGRFPRLYDVEDLTYQEEPPGQEDWQDLPTCIRLRKADCDDLSPALAAERRVLDGIPARPTHRKAVRKDGGMLYHILTEVPGRPPEDPSYVLGMR